MRSYVEKRNALILALSEFVGRPVLLASQVEPEMEPPFIVYSITSDYIPTMGWAITLWRTGVWKELRWRSGRSSDHHHVFYCLQYQPSGDEGRGPGVNPGC